MSIYLLVPLLVGTVTVLQGGFNQGISERWSLPAAIFFNNLIALIISLGFYLGLKALGAQGLFRAHYDPGLYRSWFLLPGLFGFIIVLGIPLGMIKLGGLVVMLCMIAAQIAASLLWDHYTGFAPINLQRLLGGLLCLVGCIIAIRS